MSILFFGRSHLICIEAAFEAGTVDPAPECRFLNLDEFARGRPRGRTEPAQRAQQNRLIENYDLERVKSIVASAGPVDMVCLSIRGNEHFISSVLDLRLSPDDVRARVGQKVEAMSLPWLKFFAGLHPRVLVVPPPPPLESTHILAHPGQMRAKVAQRGVSPPEVRLAAWKHQVKLLRAEAARVGIDFLELPEGVQSESGMLRPEFCGDDPTHGNTRFGAVLLAAILQRARVPAARKQVSVSAASPSPGQPKMHPYKGLPDAAFWRESVASVPAGSLDPVRDAPFGIARADKVATAGSCFAQHISKRLRQGGFQFLVTEEPALAGEDAQLRGFYDFSARYGNIYTSRQLVQLFDRAFGYFTPLDDHWSLEGGRFCDPFRPRIEPEGFASLEALREDRRGHLDAVRKMFEELDVFVFTLGLTECWMSRLDGAAYPLAPGVSGGNFDPARHVFVNLSVEDVAKDLQAFLAKLRLVNPGARMILTVSPVPLAATYSDEHVLVATTYSKSVLRVAAEMTERAHEGVLYFPSYEIITGAHARGGYFADDLRSVTDQGVSHVMQVFMNRMIADASPEAAGALEAELSEMESLAEAVCDEVLLARR